ncbi:MlaA family lipoprotein [Paenalcaligenes suwonensis]|uniref:MlaA family lipoprotein n=1 Tax=Paenalcaligenes suwonensis TaxID=1202713 RepID=UPI00140A2057|nr:VacJ family lipoprotein [Paenalcaligenes suwonensis]NHC60146.1 VacJ family lipoprotein [Paenalcaligenes suwonensis]
MNVTQQTSPPLYKRPLAIGSTLAALALVSGCATVNNPNPRDPFESYNRTMYAINYNIDQALFRPIASAYQTLTPQPAQNCFRNMFNNLGDIWSAANSFLQGRPHDFFNTLGRVLFNTTMGVGGCFDVASQMGSRRIPNDFGTTLGVWGIPTGPYLELPLLGPSTLRDTTGYVTVLAGIDSLTEVLPIMAIKNVPVRNSLMGVYIVNMRSNLLDADELVNEVALDRYSFIRDAYLQRRDAMVESRLNGGTAGDAALPDYGDDEDYDDDSSTTTAPAPAQD